MNNPNESLAICHTSDLKLCNDSDIVDILPVASIKKRRKPPKKITVFSPRRLQIQSLRL